MNLGWSFKVVIKIFQAFKMYYCLIYEDHRVRREFCLIYPENCTKSLCNCISILIENHPLRKNAGTPSAHLTKIHKRPFLFCQKVTYKEKVNQISLIDLF